MPPKSSDPVAIGKELERLQLLAIVHTAEQDYDDIPQEFFDHLDKKFKFYPFYSAKPQSWAEAVVVLRQNLKDVPDFNCRVEETSSYVREELNWASVHVKSIIEGVGGLKFTWQAEANWRRNKEGKWMLFEMRSLLGGGDEHRGFM